MSLTRACRKKNILTHTERPQCCTVALRERLCVTLWLIFYLHIFYFISFIIWLCDCVRVRARTIARVTAHQCAGVSVSFCVCYSVLIWLCSQMTVPLYNMTLKCAKCGVISSADVSTTATSNAMLVPLIIFFLNSSYPDLWSLLCCSAPPSLPPPLPPSLLAWLCHPSPPGCSGREDSSAQTFFWFIFLLCSSSVYGAACRNDVQVNDDGWFRGVLCWREVGSTKEPRGSFAFTRSNRKQQWLSSYAKKKQKKIIFLSLSFYMRECALLVIMSECSGFIFIKSYYPKVSPTNALWLWRPVLIFGPHMQKFNFCFPYGIHWRSIHVLTLPIFKCDTPLP